MRRLLVPAAAAALGALAIAVPASAHGLTAQQLIDAEWTCFPVTGLGVHCAPPGQAFPPTGPVLQLLYFDESTGEFRGTETLIRDDVFSHRNARMCPTQAGGWFSLDLPTGKYWACHRR